MSDLSSRYLGPGPIPPRTNISASRIASVADDAFLASILNRATTPPQEFDLSSDANCLAWFYSHIEHPPRPTIDPWDALELDDIPCVDVSIRKKRNSSLEFLDSVTTLDARGARSLLSDTLGLVEVNDSATGHKRETKQASTTHLSEGKSPTRLGVLSSSMPETVMARKRQNTLLSKYPKSYVQSPESCRVANSVATLMELRKLVRRRERHIKLLEEAVDLDWWRAISEEWKSVIRVLTCEIVEHVVEWREKIGKVAGGRVWDPEHNMHERSFRWKTVDNYLLKIPSDMDFMCCRACYGGAQRRNPFLLPFPLDTLSRAPDSWSCRITQAAAVLLKEEERCGTYVWDRSRKCLVASPVSAVRATEALRQSDFFKAQRNQNGHVSLSDRLQKNIEVGSRKGISRAQATRGSSKGTMSSTLSLLMDAPEGTYPESDRNAALSRDIFTPGPSAHRNMEEREQLAKRRGMNGVTSDLIACEDTEDDRVMGSGSGVRRASSLQLLPFNENYDGQHKPRRVALRPKGMRTPVNYDRDNGFDILTKCPINGCAVCEALRMERRLAVYTAKTDRSRRVGLFNALMSSRAALIKDVSATMIQALWRGAAVRQRIVRPMMFEDYRVTSDLGGTRMTQWLPKAHSTAIHIQMMVRRALSRWELYRRRRAELERVMAIRIQNMFRACKARLHLAVLRAVRKMQDEKEFASATMLQKHWRSRTEQRRYRRTITLKRAADRDRFAAERVQCAWRSYWARKRFYLLRAEISCRLLQRAWRGLMCRERLNVRLELQDNEQKWIAPAITKLEQLRSRLAEVTVAAIGSTIEALIVAIEQNESVEEQIQTYKIAVGDGYRTVDTERLRRVASTSNTDVREMMRYFWTRGRLQPPTVSLSPDILLSKLSDYEDRQICARLSLDDESNVVDDYEASDSACVASLQRQIAEVQKFIDQWRGAASECLLRRQFSRRWLNRGEIYTKPRAVSWKEEYPNIAPSLMPLPSSIAKRERQSCIVAAAIKYNHMRDYTTSCMRHDLHNLRKHFLARRRLRDENHRKKLEFARTSASSWLKQATKRAETIIRKANAEHDKAIFAVEEPWICAEDERASKMRHYLTATSFARIALWEEFVNLFDNKSRVQLFHRKERMKAAGELKQNDRSETKNGMASKSGKLDNDAASQSDEVVDPSDADAEVIVEDVTIDAKEFQEFTRRVGHPILSKSKLEEVLGYIDYKCSGRITFERVAFWFFSGTEYEVARKKSFVKHNVVMASMLVKRKQDMSKRWVALKWSRVPFIANRRAKREKREAARKYEEERAVLEKERAQKRLEDALRKEKEDALQLKEKEYLDKVAYLNGLGDNVWRLAKSDPPFEKHFRPPAWSTALSNAMVEAGILPEHRVAFGVRAIDNDEDGSVSEGVEEEENTSEKMRANEGDEGSADEVNVDTTGKSEDDVEDSSQSETTGKDQGAGKIAEEIDSNPLRHKRKSKIFSQPYRGRCRAPGNDMRISYILGQGIDIGDLQLRSKNYRKELRKRKKKREKAEAKAKAKAERLAKMSPEERLQEQLKEAEKKAKNTPEGKAARAKAKKEAAEKKRQEKRARRKAKRR